MLESPFFLQRLYFRYIYSYIYLDMLSVVMKTLVLFCKIFLLYAPNTWYARLTRDFLSDDVVYKLNLFESIYQPACSVTANGDTPSNLFISDIFVL